jgi:hypothetical protein
MKKNYTIFIALLISTFVLSAQPLINQISNADLYTSDSYSLSVQGLSIGNPGPNQTWDFSTLSGFQFDGTFSLISAMSTPFTNDFPKANFAIKFTTLESPSKPYYTLLFANSTTLEIIGQADGSVVETLDNPKTQIQFPSAYNKPFTDDYQYPTRGIISISSIYDGYGTLKTPYGTYTNVIRQKTTSTGYSNDTSYIYFTANPFRDIMEIIVYGNTSRITVYNSFTSLGLNTYKKEKDITIYPNPTTSVLHLECSNEVIIDKIVVRDLTGKIVVQQAEITSEINVEKLAAGIYTLEADSGKNKFKTKFIKK